MELLEEIIAFVAAAAALEYRENKKLNQQVKDNEKFLKAFLEEEIASLSRLINIRGIGMIWGIDVSKLGSTELANQITLECYNRKLIIEKAGRNDTVIKLMAPLTTERELLERGCKILRDTISELVKSLNDSVPITV